MLVVVVLLEVQGHHVIILGRHGKCGSDLVLELPSLEPSKNCYVDVAMAVPDSKHVTGPTV